MKTKQVVLKVKNLGSHPLTEFEGLQPQLGFLFGPPALFQNSEFMSRFQANGNCKWVGCSTAGEISHKGVTDDTAVLTGVHFENAGSRFKIATATVSSPAESDASGRKLGAELNAPDLHSVILISPGVNVNGSRLIKGLTSVLDSKVCVTGGLAGDGGKFERTYTLSPKGVTADEVIGIGIYGDGLKLKHGCMGGWDPFGKVRQVTRSKDNVLFELDGKPALDIYKEYLGEHAKDLPASGLMFPFAILNDQKNDIGLIRTILSVDDSAGSLTFAGDVEQGCFVRLMQANTNGLVAGAQGAAKNAITAGLADNALGLVVSCVGRKLVMGPSVDEEIEAIGNVLGAGCTLTGFYSYGEISPYLSDVGCQLHNQTLTISYLFERAG